MTNDNQYYRDGTGLFGPDNFLLPDLPKPPKDCATSPKEIEQIILVNLKSNFIFQESKNLGIKTTGQEKAGVLIRTFNLSDVREWLGDKRNEHQDEKILKCFDTLAQKGMLKFTRVWQRPGLRITDMSFHVEVGRGKKTLSRHSTVWQISTVRWYCEHPLKKSEHDEQTMFDITARTKAVFDRVSRILTRRAGGSASEIEKQIHHEDCEDEAQVKRLLKKLVDDKK